MTTEQGLTELKPMGVGDIFDATFKLYKARFGAFLMIALVAYLPYSLIAAFYISQLVASLGSRTEPTMMSIIGPLIPVLIMAFIVLPLCQSAMIFTVSETYLGRSLGVGQAYSRALPRLPRLLGANIIAGLVVVIGFICLIVPGIIFSLWFVLVTAVVLLETSSATGSLGRSKSLMSGNLGKGFLVLLVIGLLGWVYHVVLGMIMGALAIKSVFLSQFISTLAEVVIFPIQVAPIILLYYDLRIRKEGFDLEQLAASLQSAETAEGAN